jgi:hypothetical protein
MSLLSHATKKFIRYLEFKNRLLFSIYERKRNEQQTRRTRLQQGRAARRLSGALHPENHQADNDLHCLNREDVNRRPLSPPVRILPAGNPLQRPM